MFSARRGGLSQSPTPATQPPGTRAGQLGDKERDIAVYFLPFRGPACLSREDHSARRATSCSGGARDDGQTGLWACSQRLPRSPVLYTESLSVAQLGRAAQTGLQWPLGEPDPGGDVSRSH